MFRFCFVFVIWLLIIGTFGCQRQVNRPDVAETNAQSADRPNADRDSVPLSDSLPARADETETVSIDATTATMDKAALAAKRERLDQTVWRQEVLAQQYEQAIVRLWDELIVECRVPLGDPFGVFGRLEYDQLAIANNPSRTQLDHGISLTEFDGKPRTLSPVDGRALIERFRGEGYFIEQTEWHHSEFHPGSDGAANSTVAMAIYLVNRDSNERLVVSGDVRIDWRAERDKDGIPIPSVIDASGIRVARRKGAPIFEEILTVNRATPTARSGVQPVITYDLNNDGLSEILLGGSNELYWNRGDCKFERATLCSLRERIFEVALVADVTGDGTADFVAPGVRGDLLLYQGNENGRFTTAPIGKARGGGPLKQPQVITAGDVDGDGDLDVWIGQYKISYVGGQMPTPYYDANDGFPAFLLLNEGDGRFTPATDEAGLAEKRYRRSYGGCLVDLDVDGDLDLLVISDFAGIDVYYNDGTGYFTDMTDELVDERHLFGMSTTFADFNLDGQLDFFVTGMSSTTARRLEFMKLGRKDRPQIHMMRSRMGYGNRMYLATENGFEEPDFKDSVARTGWTWGATSLDFDNDGDSDIFVANGHSSGRSTKDHCTHFWCHDIYEGNSDPNEAVNQLFGDALKGYYDRSESWDGYQKSVLLMNQEGRRFDNVGFLMGVGQEYDGRAVISDDLDGDGLVDLLVVEDQWKDGQVLHVYRNQMESDNHWIGVRLREQGLGISPLGARILVQTADRTYVSCIKAGDSIHAQHSNTLHFGLGDTRDVSFIEVRWINGKQSRIESPDVDRYHTILAE